MSARLPLAQQRLVFVTGKGGVGKTAVTAALARAAAAAKRRVLAVEIGQGRLGTLLGIGPLPATPIVAAPRLRAVAIEPAAALGEFLNATLRFRLLSRRLLESTSFQVLAAAAPGLAEFLVLHTLLGWLEARRFGRPIDDLIIVDAPASGHSLPLLEAPRTLGTLATFGPIGEKLRRVRKMLADPAVTLICPVTTPEELAVRETIELCQALGRLGLPTAPPLVNACPPRRFSAREVEEISGLDTRHPFVGAARLQIERRRQAEAQLQALRHALGVAPIVLPFVFADPEATDGARELTEHMAMAAGLAE